MSPLSALEITIPLFLTRLLRARLSPYVMFGLEHSIDKLSKSYFMDVKLHLINHFVLSGMLIAHLTMYFSYNFMRSVCRFMWAGF